MSKMASFVAVAALAWFLAGADAHAADAPRLGQTTEVEFTPSLPKRGPGSMYMFMLRYNQGERFRFEVSPVGGASLKTEIFVDLPDQSGSRPGPTFEGTGAHESHDWTMTKAPPGSFMYVKLVGYSLGKVRLKVTKVGGEGGPEPKSEVDELRALVDQLQRRIAELEGELKRRNIQPSPR